MFKKSIIATAAALTIAATMAATPAQALSKKGAIALGAFSALAIGAAAAAHANDRGYRGGYRGHRISYRHAARKCAYRFGRHTWRFDRCMARHGF
jgi:hypothetical protein